MPFTVAVCGGGIGGLTLAIGLQRHNVAFHIYEAAAAFAEIGAGVSFGPNSIRAMSLIDPSVKAGYDRQATSNRDEGKKETWFDFSYGMDSMHDGEKSGQHITSVLAPPVGQSCVHRAHFLDELVRLIPKGSATFGKKVSDIEELPNGEGVRLHFADGTTAMASIAIGTDGIKSNIRPIVLGKDHPAAKATFSGKYAYRGLIPMSKAAAALGEERARNAQMYLGYDGHILTFPIEKGETMNVVAFQTEHSGKWENEQWVLPMDRSKMQDDFRDWGEQAQSILKLMEKPDLWALFNHPPAPCYYKGRICLSGDSAHASTPHQGAGAGMALEDAYILSNLLGRVRERLEEGDDATEEEKVIAAAFEAYDVVRRERTQRLVTTSRQVAEIYEFQRAGDGKEEVHAALKDWFRWIWDHDLQKDLEEAFGVMDGEKAVGTRVRVGNSELQRASNGRGTWKLQRRASSFRAAAPRLLRSTQRQDSSSHVLHTPTLPATSTSTLVTYVPTSSQDPSYPQSVLTVEPSVHCRPQSLLCVYLLKRNLRCRRPHFPVSFSATKHTTSNRTRSRRLHTPSHERPSPVMSCITAPSMTLHQADSDTSRAFSTAREIDERSPLLSRNRVARRHSYDSNPRRNSSVYSSEAVFVRVDLFLSELERRLDRLEKYRQEQLNHIDARLRQGYTALKEVRDSCSYASGELLWGAARARATILVETLETRYNDVITTRESLEQKAQASMRLMESYLSQLEARVQEKQSNISAVFGEGRSRLNTLSLQTRELIDEGIDKAIKAKEALSESVSAALSRAAQTRLITYDELPVPWRVNPHIKRGYRFTNRKIECITSVFRPSNEMVNIWSHLIGLIVVLAIAFHFYPTTAVFGSSSKWDILMAACFFAAACKCLICSCLWHTMNSIADDVLLERFACVDYTGISLLIACSILSTEWTAFYCEPVSRTVYMSLTATLGVLGVILPWNPTFNRVDMAWARVAFYVSLALTGFAPVIQLNLTRGPAWSFYFYAPIAKSVLVYFVGAIIYASQVPEKWWPGLFDYAGGSHNIWHLAVLGGILFHYTAMMHFFNGAFRRAAAEGCSWQ